MVLPSSEALRMKKCIVELSMMRADYLCLSRVLMVHIFPLLLDHITDLSGYSFAELGSTDVHSTRALVFQEEFS